MKKLLFSVLLLLSLTLSSCNLGKISYDFFEEQSLQTYYQAETVSNNRYVLYYYNSNDEKSSELQQDILSFFKEFEALDFYLLDTAEIKSSTSSFGELAGEPIIYVISSQKVLEEYIGSTEINEFIIQYSNIEFDYSLFESQHLTSYEEVLAIENDSYILYYYLDSCPHCIASKPSVLPWAFTKSVEDIYFMEGSTVPNADQLPTELIILNSGTPILVLMTNGKFADEFYSGKEDVLNYIDSIGDGDIHLSYSYDDFEANHIDFFETMSITSDLHFEYYYSPICSHCNLIKGQLLNFFYDLEDIPFYLINTSEANGVVKIPGFRGTPALYILKDNVVVGEYIGSLAIPEFIDDYYSGDFDINDY